MIIGENRHFVTALVKSDTYAGAAANLPHGRAEFSATVRRQPPKRSSGSGRRRAASRRPSPGCTAGSARRSPRAAPAYVPGGSRVARIRFSGLSGRGLRTLVRPRPRRGTPASSSQRYSVVSDAGLARDLSQIVTVTVAPNIAQFTVAGSCSVHTSHLPGRRRRRTAELDAGLPEPAVGAAIFHAVKPRDLGYFGPPAVHLDRDGRTLCLILHPATSTAQPNACRAQDLV